MLRIKAERMDPRHSPSPMGRLPPMEEEAKPTGITYQEAIEAAKQGGTVTFEGREARVVGFDSKSSIDEPNTSRLTLDLGDEYLVIVGHFWGGEFIEERRQEPFSGPP
jgi:hypothetical protein